MKSIFIAAFFVIAFASAAHLPDCTNFSRFPSGNCAEAVQSLHAAQDLWLHGSSGKYWLMAQWTDECKTHADKETCITCNTMDVNTAWASTNATITCTQLCQNAANLVGSSTTCTGCC